MASAGDPHALAARYVDTNLALRPEAALDLLRVADSLRAADVDLAMLAALLVLAVSRPLGGRRAPDTGGELTPAERRVAGAVCEGLSNREVAALLVLSERTVEAHLCSIFRKLEVRNRTQLALRL